MFPSVNPNKVNDLQRGRDQMDKIYYNGDILTMEDTRTEPEAVLISDGIIAFTGSLKEAVRAAHQPEMTDLNGKTLMPAFIDGHSHISLVAQFSQFADLSGCCAALTASSRLPVNAMIPSDIKTASGSVWVSSIVRIFPL